MTSTVSEMGWNILNIAKLFNILRPGQEYGAKFQKRTFYLVEAQCDTPAVVGSAVLTCIDAFQVSPVSDTLLETLALVSLKLAPGEKMLLWLQISYLLVIFN